MTEKHRTVSCMHACMTLFLSERNDSKQGLSYVFGVIADAFHDK